MGLLEKVHVAFLCLEGRGVLLDVVFLVQVPLGIDQYVYANGHNRAVISPYGGEPTLMSSLRLENILAL